MEALEQAKLQGAPTPRLPRTARVKNKQAAPIQISAEQILREATERQEDNFRPPEQQIMDEEELEEYKLKKRKEFETKVTRNRFTLANYVKYAKWEESQKEFRRARSVFERAIDVDYRDPSIWQKYAEMEMRNKFINRARNVWDRAVVLLPRVDRLWLKYAYMEEMLGNIAGARRVFERWMEFRPSRNAWTAYVKMEMRYGEVDRARDIIERFVMVHPTVDSWLYYAKFEQSIEAPDKNDRVRQVYERACELLGDMANDERLYMHFANFEERCKETERARSIYKFALDHLPKEKVAEVFNRFVLFEKQYGDQETIEEVIVSKRRFQYEEELKSDPHNYDIWFDYARLEESSHDIERTREVYERAIANVPPLQEKRYWRRYVYLWVNYALFEEMQAKNTERTREVYRALLDLIPHKAFSFSKVWIMYSLFEIRAKNLQAARSIMGKAIGMAPKDKIFKTYIKIETTLGNFDRCRKLYDKYVEWNPENSEAWLKYAELEKTMEEWERARGIFEIAIGLPNVDYPEALWMAYIDMESELEEYDRVRHLYERLLDKASTPKVWISYAIFESSKEQFERARALFERAYKEIKATGNKEDRVVILESWKEFERQVGGEEGQGYQKVESMMPTKVTRKRPITTESGEEEYEEYIDYIFPEEAQKHSAAKILEIAQAWKKQKQEN